MCTRENHTDTDLSPSLNPGPTDGQEPVSSIESSSNGKTLQELGVMAVAHRGPHHSSLAADQGWEVWPMAGFSNPVSLQHWHCQLSYTPTLPDQNSTRGWTERLDPSFTSPHPSSPAEMSFHRGVRRHFFPFYSSWWISGIFWPRGLRRFDHWLWFSWRGGYTAERLGGVESYGVGVQGRG